MLKKSLVLYCFILLFYSVNFAQVNDSLLTNSQIQNKIYNSPVKEVKKLIYTTLWIDRDIDLAHSYSLDFLKRGIDQGDPNIRLFANFYISNTYYQKSNYKGTIVYAKAAIKEANALHDSIQLVHSSILKGSAYMKLANHKEALQPFLSAKEISEYKDLRYEELVCRANIGFIRIRLKRYSDALEVLNETLSKLSTKEYQNTQQFSYTHIRVLLLKGLCLKELNKLDEALKVNQEGVALTIEYNDPALKGDFYINTGNIFYKKGEYHKALGYLLEGKEILKSKNSADSQNILLANFYIAQCQYQLQSYEEALTLLMNNFEFTKEITHINKLDEMYELAIQIAKIRKDRDLEISLTRDHLKSINTIHRDQIETKDVLYEDDITQIKTDNQLLKSKQNKEKVVVITSIGIAIALLLALITAFIAFRKKAKNNEKQFKKLIENIENKSLKAQQIKDKKNISKGNIKDEKAKKIIEKLIGLEHSTFFLSSECNLYNTAKKIDTNTTYLSKALNKYKKQSFNQYLNEYRINTALLKLQNSSKFRSYTVEAIAHEIGYKSVNTFNKAFKEKTNLNPSYYIKRIIKVSHSETSNL